MNESNLGGFSNVTKQEITAEFARSRSEFYVFRCRRTGGGSQPHQNNRVVDAGREWLGNANQLLRIFGHRPIDFCTFDGIVLLVDCGGFDGCRLARPDYGIGWFKNDFGRTNIGRPMPGARSCQTGDGKSMHKNERENSVANEVRHDRFSWEGYEMATPNAEARKNVSQF